MMKIFSRSVHTCRKFLGDNLSVPSAGWNLKPSNTDILYGSPKKRIRSRLSVSLLIYKYTLHLSGVWECRSTASRFDTAWTFFHIRCDFGTKLGFAGNPYCPQQRSIGGKIVVATAIAGENVLPRSLISCYCVNVHVNKLIILCICENAVSVDLLFRAAPGKNNHNYFFNIRPVSFCTQRSLLFEDIGISNSTFITLSSTFNGAGNILEFGKLFSRFNFLGV